MRMLIVILFAACVLSAQVATAQETGSLKGQGAQTQEAPQEQTGSVADSLAVATNQSNQKSSEAQKESILTILAQNEFFPQQAAAYQKQNQRRIRSKLRGTNPVEIRTSEALCLLQG